MREWHGREMYTVGDMYRITGTDPQTQALRVYERDKWKLLMPTETTGSGTRLYDKNALLRFAIIRIFVALGYSLDRIKEILDNPDFDIRKITDEQLYEIEVKKAELDQKAEIVKAIRKYGIEFFTEATLGGTALDKYIADHPVEVEKPKQTEEEKNLEKVKYEVFEQFLTLESRDYDSDGVQQLINEMAEDFADDEDGFANISNYLLIALIMLSTTETTAWLDEQGGKGTAEFVAFITVSAVLRSFDFRINRIRYTYKEITDEKQRREYILQKMENVRQKANEGSLIDAEYLGRLIKDIQTRIGAEDPVDAVIYLIENGNFLIGCYEMVETLFGYLKETIRKNRLPRV